MLHRSHDSYQSPLNAASALQARCRLSPWASSATLTAGQTCCMRLVTCTLTTSTPSAGLRCFAEAAARQAKEGAKHAVEGAGEGAKNAAEEAPSRLSRVLQSLRVRRFPEPIPRVWTSGRPCYDCCASEVDGDCAGTCLTDPSSAACKTVGRAGQGVCGAGWSRRVRGNQLLRQQARGSVLP